MAIGIVDPLEVIEVHGEKAQGGAGCETGLQLGLGPVGEVAPVGDSGQGVGLGQAPELSLHLLALRYVAKGLGEQGMSLVVKQPEGGLDGKRRVGGRTHVHIDTALAGMGLEALIDGGQILLAKGGGR